VGVAITDVCKVPPHDPGAWTRFPSRQDDVGLHVTEVTLACGEPSRL